MKEIEQKSLFNVLNDNFFGLLSGKNKERNFLLLIVVDQAFGNGLTINRKNLINIVSEYIENHNFDSVGDLGESEEHNNGVFVNKLKENNAYNKALSFIYTLEQRGWLEREVDKGNFLSIVSRTDGFTNVLSALINLLNEDTDSKEQFRHILSLYQNVKLLFDSVTATNPDYEKTTFTLQTIDDERVGLENDLLSINSRIKRFVLKAMKNVDANEKQILKTLVIDYQTLPAYVAFHNLQTRNDVSKYSNSIIKMLSTILQTQYKEGIVNNYLLIKKSQDKDKANSEIDEIIRNVINQMLNISSSIQSISQRNRMYVVNSSDRIKFRLNNEKDIQGDINRLLKIIKDLKLDDDLVFDNFNFYSNNQIDDKSLFPVFNISKVVPKSLPFVKHEPNELIKLKAKNLLLNLNLYSMSDINDFVKKIIGDRNEMLANEADINDIKDLLRLVLIPVYSANSDAIYTVRKEYKEFKKENYLIDDFKIILKGE